jgi:hypothetical protein
LGSRGLAQEVTLMVNGVRGSVRRDAVAVEFDDERLVANAGLLLTATLSARLGLERLVDQTLDLGRRAGAARPGRKLLSLVHAIAAGADSIDDCELLRAGATQPLLGHRVMAPSTLGTFLRAFTFGHVRQLDRVLACSLERAWAAGAGPAGERLVVDLDSFVGEVYGYEKEGATVGYTGGRGYHPLIASRAGSGEILHARLRKGSAGSGRGALRFVQELLPRLRRAGASGEIIVRADSAFWNKQLLAYLTAQGCRYSISLPMHKLVVEAIATIAEDAWQPLADYPESGICELAETTLAGERLIVRRVHLRAQEAQAELFPYWRHFAFLSNRQEEMQLLDREHRQHAEVELAIRDLKDQALAHFPSGRFAANCAWTVIACLAHNLQRWTGMLGLEQPTPRTARTIRRWLLALPGRLTRSARRWTLHLPARWPWQRHFLEALTRIRALPAAA